MIRKKTTALLLSFVLCFGLVPAEAFASVGESLSAPVVVAETDDAASDGEGLSAEASSASAAEMQDQGVENTGDISSHTVDSSGQDAGDTIEYVYIDKSVVALGEEQNIVVAFNEESGNISGAVLTLRDSNGAEYALDASAYIDGAVRFTTTFFEDDQALSYTLVSLSWVDGNSQEKSVDLSNGVAGDRYEFDCVDGETANALAAGDGEVSAAVIDENGQLQSTDSVEDALAIAGASNSDANDVATYSADSRSAASSRENYLIVAIDPGHGYNDSGAVGNGLRECDLTWSIANHFKDELSTYSGVTPYLTTSGEEPGLQTRVDRAVAMGADVFVSVHINSASASANGAEVWVPNNSSYNYDAHTVGAALGQKIENQLAALGLSNRGVKTKDWGYDPDGGYSYPDGSMKDYYSVIRNSRLAGIPGIIVEHAFISNSSDASKLASDAFRAQLGIADATGVAQQYGLLKDSDAKNSSLVSATAHVANVGWESTVYDGKVAGTTGKAFNLEALRLNLQNEAAQLGGIEYRANVGGSWQDWASNGAMAGTTGQNKAIEALQIRLTGNASTKYDVYYRVHSAEVGWLGWAKNGESAGTLDYGYGAQAVEVVLVEKGSSAPGSTLNAFMSKGDQPMSIRYSAHVANYGWQDWTNGVAGTTGKSLAMEAFKVAIDNAKVDGSVRAKAFVQDIGWMNWSEASSICGTTGRALHLEAMQLELTGMLSQQYDIYYRAHVSNIGWMSWAKNGEKAGTSGYGLPIEAVEIQLIKKGDAAPGDTSIAFQEPLISYSAHVANIGWQSSVSDGDTAGTTGRALSMEALKVSLASAAGSGSVAMRTHIQNLGWQDWTTNGTAGTTGRALGLEAIQLQLQGEAQSSFDIYYRVHSADFGWLGWVKNGEPAGSQGYGRSIQAIQIQLVPKGSNAGLDTSAVGFWNKDDVDAANDAKKIAGYGKATVESLVAAYEATGIEYPADVYSQYGAPTLEDFCSIIVREARFEGIRPEIVFGQAMHETGWLQFGGSVKPEQCNFAGLGATTPTTGGASFGNVSEGIRAQVQHLKAYANSESLNGTCVDPRFNLVQRGCAPLVTDLNGRWAVPGTNYGQSILKIANTAI